MTVPISGCGKLWLNTQLLLATHSSRHKLWLGVCLLAIRQPIPILAAELLADAGVHHLDAVAHCLGFAAAEAELVTGAELRRLPRLQPPAVEPSAGGGGQILHRVAARLAIAQPRVRLRHLCQRIVSVSGSLTAATS